MYVAVETHPNLHPASCSWGGYGLGPAKLFLRVINPDLVSDTLLISDITFNEWAKAMGYSKITEEETLIKELRNEANELANALSVKLDILANLRAMLPNLEVFEQRVQDFLGAVGRLCDPIDKSESGDTVPDSNESDGTSESSNESQLDGIQPATDDVKPPRPSTPVRPADPRRAVHGSKSTRE